MAESDKKNITYLFGAGASCNALPLISSFSKAINECITRLEEKNAVLHVPIEKLIDNLKWLKKEADNHASIDTYAKKLYLMKDDDNLNRLKATLSCFFLIEQIDKPFDSRYDTFYATILEYGMRFPANIKILSWNYDMQFEKCFAQYISKNLYNRITEDLQSYPTTNPDTNSVDVNKFCIFRLNGIAGLHMEQTGELKRNIALVYKTELTHDVLTEILRIYDQYLESSKKLQPLLNFAWEESTYQSTIETYIEKICESTDILIAIGYSFPFFNRNFDRLIIKKMDKLKKIYLQVPKADQDSYEDRIRSIIPDIQIVKITDLKQFYIPNEY